MSKQRTVTVERTRHATTHHDASSARPEVHLPEVRLIDDLATTAYSRASSAPTRFSDETTAAGRLVRAIKRRSPVA